MSDPTLAELEAAAAAATKAVADAKAAIAAVPPMPHTEAHALYTDALAQIDAAPANAHAIAAEALTALEAGGVTGRCIDVLAQHVIDHKEGASATASDEAKADGGKK